jgi:SAM-dependent methyltransferase
MNDGLPYPPEYFMREDDSDDALFYTSSRKVVHIDDGAIATLRDTVFARLLPQGGAILDLMSSWRTHLPDSLKPSRVVGLGMNADEMADNPQLTSFTVQNLNREPVLPYADAEFDAVVCTVSVQYLMRPLEVFREVHRVLKPGAPCVVSFSNRCFSTKAIFVWLYTDDEKHQLLVSDYLERGGFSNVQTEAHTPRRADPLFVVTGTA